MAFDKETGTMGIKQYHIDLSEGDVGEYVLLPGDPFRTDIVAQYLDDVELVGHKRAHKTYTGFYKGIKMSVTSTGMGCPSAAMVLEELANIGGRVFLRLGTSAGLKPDVKVGDILVTIASMKNEGTSRMYVPEVFPAVADIDLTSILIKTAREISEGTDHAVHAGLTATDDAFYAETPEWVERLVGLGLTNIEMESSAIFTICHKRQLRGGCICACSANLNTEEVYFGKKNEKLPAAIEMETKIALETFYQFDAARQKDELLRPMI